MQCPECEATFIRPTKVQHGTEPERTYKCFCGHLWQTVEVPVSMKFRMSLYEVVNDEEKNKD